MVTAGLYQGPLKSAILGFKQHGRRARGAKLAALLLDCCHRPQVEALAVIPSSARRLRYRGFNPAAEIARHLAASWKLPLYRDLLAQPGDPRPQKSRGRESRAEVCFQCRRPGSQLLWLVDDVVTTGSTLRAARDSLSAAGYRVKGAAAVARVDQEGSRPLQQPVAAAQTGEKSHMAAVSVTSQDRWGVRTQRGGAG